jgi:hypothetical protein
MLNWKAKRYAEAEAGLLALKLRDSTRGDGRNSVHYDCHYYLGKLLRDCGKKEESHKWFKEFLSLCDQEDEFSVDYRKNHKRIIKEVSRHLGYTKSWLGHLISKFKNS